MLEQDDYLFGLDSFSYIGDSAPRVTIPPTPRITLKGLRYLQENTMMRSASGQVVSPEFYVWLAKAWLDDEDAEPDKTALYYEHIVKKE